MSEFYLLKYSNLWSDTKYFDGEADHLHFQLPLAFDFQVSYASLFI